MNQKLRLEQLQSTHQLLIARIVDLYRYGYDDQSERISVETETLKNLLKSFESVFDEAAKIKGKLQSVALELKNQSSLAGRDGLESKLINTQHELESCLATVIGNHPAKRTADAKRVVRQIEKKTKELRKYLGIEPRRSWLSFLLGRDK